ncbi:PTS glucose transporter subunit IIA [Periweissella cryptocerci]|uniref:PTS glucose transporter subunit IIA n=1 Tax=Periweissella cryptocerci TaxID=2506420 RepID=A0A4V1AIE1_9LACO|nr:PTS glucose transporter subunit IIA [Periweissella cryptocerci]QBO35185.1 PTS glucose transporter subunit IIA [Periweissella cryptocerci]
MFKMFKKQSEPELDNTLYAPTDGTIINLADVSDPVFAQEVMGKGFAIQPTSDAVSSPVAGKVTMVAETKHAVGLTMSNGLEVLVHMGIDTVEMNGTPFNLDVKVGDIVAGGAPLANMDRDAIINAKLEDTIMIIITNTADKLDNLNVTLGLTTNGAPIGTVAAK